MENKNIDNNMLRFLKKQDFEERIKLLATDESKKNEDGENKVLQNYISLVEQYKKIEESPTPIKTSRIINRDNYLQNPEYAGALALFLYDLGKVSKPLISEVDNFLNDPEN